LCDISDFEEGDRTIFQANRKKFGDQRGCHYVWRLYGRDEDYASDSFALTSCYVKSEHTYWWMARIYQQNVIFTHVNVAV